MNRYRKLLVASAVVLAVIAVIMTVTDIFFRIYEKKTFIKEVDQNAPVFDLGALGFNDYGPPLAREEESGEFRILSIGDSYTAAITKPQYTFSAVLERELNRLGTGRRVRVINLGVGGTSFPDYMADYLFWSKILRFDAVVFNICLANDFTDVEFKPFSPKLFRREKFITGIGSTLPHVFPFRFLDYAYGIIRAEHNLKPADDYYNPSYQVPWDRYVLATVKVSRIFTPRELPGFGNGLDWASHFMAFIKQLEDSGVKVAVMASPPHLFFNERLLRETAAAAGVKPDTIDPALPLFLLNEFARRHGVTGEILDPSPCLAFHAAKGEGLYYGTDTHWTVRGNMVIGDFLADALARRWFGVAPSPPASDCPPGAKAGEAGAPAKAAVLGMIKQHGD
jgi:hypothetical protein